MFFHQIIRPQPSVFQSLVAENSTAASPPKTGSCLTTVLSGGSRGDILDVSEIQMMVHISDWTFSQMNHDHVFGHNLPAAYLLLSREHRTWCMMAVFPHEVTAKEETEITIIVHFEFHPHCCAFSTDGVSVRNGSQSANHVSLFHPLGAP